MVQRVATTDYRPKSPAIRAALGLPILAPAPVCPSCGVVHVAARCPAKRKPVLDYDAWRAANMDKLLSIVNWAEGERG